MVYTEIKQKNKRKYYYRVKSMREGNKFKKKRIYLGVNLTKEDLKKKQKKADIILSSKKEKNSQIFFNHSSEGQKKEKVLKNIKGIIQKIKEVLKKNKVKKAGIFGSYARGEQKKNSDIDILVEPPKGIGFGFAGIGMELEEKLGKKVHLVTYKYLSPYIKKDILEEEVKII